MNFKFTRIEFWSDIDESLTPDTQDLLDSFIEYSKSLGHSVSPEDIEKKDRRAPGPTADGREFPFAPRKRRRRPRLGAGWRVYLNHCVGFQFYIYVSRASGAGPNTVQRPPGVEGFLPTGAQMGWKLFTKMTGLTAGVSAFLVLPKGV